MTVRDQIRSDQIQAEFECVYTGHTGFEFLGASFLRFGCFLLRSSFSRASFSKLPLNPSASNVHTQAKSKRKHKGYVYVLEATDQETTEKNNALEADDGHGSRPKRKRKERHVMDI